MLVCSPLLCHPAEKAHIEAANAVEQVDYISLLLEHFQPTEVRESYVRMFHRLAVSGIYPCAGHYRTADLDVAITGTAHRIPSPSRVPYLVTDLVDQLNRDRVDGVPGVDRAAYALWRLAWIHPFAGGNGRTARALAYLVLCMDLQTVLPGLPQLPTRLYQRDAEVLAALQAGDAGETSGQGPDLQPMRALLQDIIAQQLESAKRD